MCFSERRYSFHLVFHWWFFLTMGHCAGVSLSRSLITGISRATLRLSCCITCKIYLISLGVPLLTEQVANVFTAFIDVSWIEYLLLRLSHGKDSNDKILELILFFIRYQKYLTKKMPQLALFHYSLNYWVIHSGRPILSIFFSIGKMQKKCPVSQCQLFSKLLVGGEGEAEQGCVNWDNNIRFRVQLLPLLQIPIKW